MSAKAKVLAELPGFSSFGPASSKAVLVAEQALGTTFSADYREAALAYGAVEVDGHELTGVVSAPRLNVVQVTKKFSSLYPWLPEGSYVIEDTGIDGVVACQEPNGTVCQVSPDGHVGAIATSLVNYLAL